MQPSELPLKNIHIPEAISWWPMATGWWILLVSVTLVLFLSIGLYKRLTRQSAVKTAKKLLIQLKQDTTKNELQKVMEISALIRRVAMSVAPRAECASLTGETWLAYLDKSVQDHGFTEGVGQCLADVSYRKYPIENINLSELINLTERWLKAQNRKLV